MRLEQCNNISVPVFLVGSM